MSTALPTYHPGLLERLGQHPRLVLAVIALGVIGLLAFGLYLQHVEGLEPCPMCIVQRYADVLIVLVAGLGTLVPRKSFALGASGLVAALAGFGAFVAARQSFLQWNPPEIVTCGRDFYGMIETFPLKRAIPMIFKGGGDCSAIDWTFMGLTIANWSFLNFMLIMALCLGVLLGAWRASR